MDNSRGETPALLPIVFESEDFLLLNKPIGIGMHNETGVDGIISLLRKQLDVDRLYPVHRLDKATSGALLVAKNLPSARALSIIFQERRIEKYYLALSRVKPKKKQGTVIGDLAPARNGSWRLLKERSNPSITQFFNYGLSDGLRLSIVRPYTGKTHQIRVVMKALGAAILGDDRYGGQKADRLYLHAYLIKFTFYNKVYQFAVDPVEGVRFLDTCFRDKLSVLPCPDKLPWPQKSLYAFL